RVHCLRPRPGRRAPSAPPSVPTRRSSDLVGAVAADSGALTLGVGDLADDVQLAGGVVELGLDVGEAVDAGDDLGGVQIISRINRSEEHTSELQSRFDLVCRLLLETNTQNR